MVPCDGAGKEVVPEAVKVLRAAGADFEFEELDINADAYLRTGTPIPDEAWKKLAAADAILFGAVGDPRVPDTWPGSCCGFGSSSTSTSTCGPRSCTTTGCHRCAARSAGVWT